MPVYPLVGSIVGVLGVVAALTFAAGVGDASDHPERFGQVAQLQSFVGFNGEDFAPVDELLPLLADDPDVVAVNNTRQGVVESGPVPVPAFVLDPVDDPLPVVVIEGRLPAAPDEITLAPRSAHDTGAEMGDTVELVGSKSTGSYTVTGIAFVPEGPHNAYDSGAWMRPDTYDDLITGFKFHNLDLVLRVDADPEVVATRVNGVISEVLDVSPEEVAQVLAPLAPPSRLAELQRLPLFLAGFLALLAVAAVGHALATAVRRRRHDLAVLCALGLTRWLAERRHRPHPGDAAGAGRPRGRRAPRVRARAHLVAVGRRHNADRLCPTVRGVGARAHRPRCPARRRRPGGLAVAPGRVAPRGPRPAHGVSERNRLGRS